MGVCDFGKGSSMIVVGLQTLFDVVDFVRASSNKANWLGGVVLVGLGGHCRQPERSAEVHTLDDGLINAAVHSTKACLRCLPLGIHFVGDLVRRRLQAVILRRKSWAEKENGSASEGSQDAKTK